MLIFDFFQTNTSATVQTNGETKTTLERRETKTSLIPASFDHKFEPQVLFTVTKENQVTIVINQREIHQHAEIVKSEMVWWFAKNWPQWFDVQKNDHNGLMVSQKIDHNGLISKKMTTMVWWFPKNDNNGLMVFQKWPQWLDGYPKIDYNDLISKRMTSMVWWFPSKNDHNLQSIIKKETTW